MTCTTFEKFASNATGRIDIGAKMCYYMCMFKEMWYGIINFVKGWSNLLYIGICAFFVLAILFSLKAFLKENKKYDKFKASKLWLVMIFFAILILIIFVRN